MACPKCRSEDVRHAGSSSTHDYYVCNECQNTWQEKKINYGVFLMESYIFVCPKCGAEKRVLSLYLPKCDKCDTTMIKKKG